MQNPRPADGVDVPIQTPYKNNRLCCGCNMVVIWLGCEVECMSRQVRLSYETLIVVFRMPIVRVYWSL